MSSLQQTLPKRHQTFPSYALPPLDGSLTLPDLYEWHSRHSPKHPLFVFEDEPGRLRTILMEEFVQGLNRTAKLTTDAVGADSISPASGKNVPVVSILGTLDTITYTCLLLGIMRAGCVVFPISTRNSPAAVAHLLAKTNSQHVFVSSDQAMQNLISTAKAMLPKAYEITTHATPTFEELYPHDGVDALNPSFVAPKRSAEQYAAIYHSSGSTAFPKPIYFTHRAFIQFAVSALVSDVDFCGKVFGMHTNPVFHALSVYQLTIPAAMGMTVAVFKPQSPPVVPNSNNTIEAFAATKVDIILLAPMFYELWSREDQSIEILKKLDYALYGGGPLSKDAGDILSSRGVRLVSVYAATECMSICHFIPKDIGRDWDYFKFHPDRDVRLLDEGENQYNLAVMRDESFSPNVFNITIEGVEGYLMNDLLSPHPTRNGFYKVVGRADDQIMHSSGEKTNPGPLEKILMHDPHVSGAVLFGRGRFNVGVLVNPTEDLLFDPSDVKKLSEYRNLIWPSVEKMNAYAPSHSRLFKEMIVVTSPEKPLTYTAKGTIRRQACLNEYEAEINAAYDAVAESSQSHIRVPDTWNVEDIEDYVSRVVTEVMEEPEGKLDHHQDLFEVGLDSLQATWIRNAIFQAMRDQYSEVVRNLSQNIVYDHPTISDMALFIFNAINGSAESDESIEQKRQKLFDLVNKYTQNIPERPRSTSLDVPSEKVVLLTGGTGSLGANILAWLLKDPNVATVYALSRTSSSGSTARDRHIRGFEREDIPTDLLNSKVQFFDGDPALEHFGLPVNLFTKLQSEVTHIILNGWRVNFNVSITSFESNIRGVRNAIDFSLVSTQRDPPAIFYISSVSALQRWTNSEPAPEVTLPEPDTSIGLGYGESKWVSERILSIIASKTTLTATSIRCGQMTGGQSGAWNQHEWFPSLVKSSIALGMFPAGEGDISWISAHEAGGAIVDMLDAKEDVFHLVHSKPVHWNEVASAFTKALQIPLVSYQEWLDALEHKLIETGTDAIKVEKSFDEVPALRLIDFFRAAKMSPDREPIGLTRLASEKAQAASKVLREAEKVGEKDVERWLSYWQKSGFLPA